MVFAAVGSTAGVVSARVQNRTLVKPFIKVRWPFVLNLVSSLGQ